MHQTLASYTTPAHQTVEVRLGDLTQEDTDAIVNAANSRLAHGGGVAGAIVRRGGREIQEESRRWVQEHGPVPTGQVAVTGAGRLPARYVIHAVGPVWRGGHQDEAALLRQAVWNSLARAHQMGLASIALPAISTGIFGFPKDRGARIIVETVLEFLHRHPDSPLRRVRLTNIDEATARLLQRALAEAVQERQGRRP